ncbi:hypothetical protein HanHA300_Chr09g0338881 [Helianthus annuus]|nr:hypothetical protein HanHA300_Chr09g0338881 [Helianthus annuus]
MFPFQVKSTSDLRFVCADGVFTSEPSIGRNLLQAKKLCYLCWRQWDGGGWDDAVVGWWWWMMMNR